MAYNPDKQYRCDIVRSRSIKYIDDLLPAYASIIDALCPCEEKDFADGFNNKLKVYLQELGVSANIKALNNHRTETAKTLFGMYYVDHLKKVQVSERTKQYLTDGDQPAFFKDICYKMQFPNGMTISKTMKKRVEDGVSVYPCRFLLETMQIANNKGILLSKQDVGYYVLNSEDVLTGKSEPKEVVKRIISDRKKGITHVMPNGSYDRQHITGIITYLKYANLVNESKGKTKGEIELSLNNLETAAINIFIKNRKKKLEFDVSKYIDGTGGTATVKKEFRSKWDRYNAELSNQYVNFYTLPSSLGISTIKIPQKSSKSNTAVIGTVGEKYVYNYEVDRVSRINTSYGTNVKNRADERKIGFDIESVCALGANPMKPMYIEVKTTIRVTEPSTKSHIDTVNLTHYEWKAACNYPDQFYIYRVYLVKGKVLLYIIGNVCDKVNHNLIDVTASSYRMKFDVADERVADNIG